MQDVAIDPIRNFGSFRRVKRKIVEILEPNVSIDGNDDNDSIDSTDGIDSIHDIKSNNSYSSDDGSSSSD